MSTSPTGSTSSDGRLPVIEGDLSALGAWLARQDWRGYDPYDALSSPALRAILGHTKVTRQLAIQTLKPSGSRLRALLGVPKQSFAKALALGLSAYARMGKDCEAFDEATARSLLAQLIGKQLAGGLWGYEFDVQTRWAHYGAGTPNVIATSFAIHALLDAAEALGCATTDTARDAARELVRTQFLAGARPFFSYVPSSDVLMHNANALAASAVARVGHATSTTELVQTALDAAVTTADAQASDGSWPYGEGTSLGWVDGFHTAYTLRGLAAVHEALPDDRLSGAIEQGREFYRTTCFDAPAVPRYYANRPELGDCHTAATAISYFAGPGGDKTFASALYDWARETLREPDGSYRSSQSNAMPYLRWSEAHMFLALADLRAALKGGTHA